MERKGNETYKQYVDEVFAYFKQENVHEGNGLLIKKILLAQHDELGGKHYNYLDFTIDNLVRTEYLSENNGLYILTAKGYSYIQGEPLIGNQIDLPAFVNANQDKNELFEQLWKLIGVEGIAPFYVKGSIFLKTISAYLPNIISNYTEFINDLKKQGKSQSRYSWYKELFLSISADDIQHFLSDLSKEIREVYKADMVEKTPIEDIFKEIPFVEPKQVEPKQVEPKQVEPKLDFTNDQRKKVFITYCWETNTDKNHAAWVQKLASDLKAHFEVIIDVEQPLGIELNKFMEQQIAMCDKVLIIATPEYKKRADERICGVGYETSIITNNLVNDQNSIKFIPIIRKGDVKTAYPTYLGNRKGLQMTENDNYDEALKELIDNLEKW